MKGGARVRDNPFYNSKAMKIVQSDAQGKCTATALRLLSYRPRSEAELRVRLSRKFDSETIDNVITKLRDTLIIDDTSFARFWRDQRDSLSPRSKRLIRTELRQKGIDSELIADITQDIDDDENAYRAAHKKASVLKPEGYETFRRKLSAFLSRRGFNYEVINHAINRLWRELN